MKSRHNKQLGKDLDFGYFLEGDPLMFRSEKERLALLKVWEECKPKLTKELEGIVFLIGTAETSNNFKYFNDEWNN